MEAVVVSLGGSILVKPDGVDVNLARAMAEVLGRVAANHRVVAVIGGGPVARTYIRGARALGSDEASLDDLGIAITRINARVLIAAVQDAYPRPAESLDEAAAASRTHPVVVMGGTHPGHTTDAVAIMMGEKLKAKRVVIATNVDGVYSADPRKDPDARRLTELTAKELVDITIGSEQQAGSAGVVDPLGAKLLARSSMDGAVVKGTDLKSLEAALLGQPFDGSRIRGGN